MMRTIHYHLRWPVLIEAFPFFTYLASLPSLFDQPKAVMGDGDGISR
jgi:hypothetical protein